MNKKKTAINPTREEDFPLWYIELVKQAELAESSDVRGCMVVKPWGFGIWENIRSILDRMFKDLGHENAYFPLFIPLKYLQKEATHVEGFAKECAVVTHHRLEMDKEGQLQPAGPLDEPLVVRPTSETIIGEMFAKWITSYRDLPLKINQWCNVVRWEMRTRMFLRTTEILWQEGHTAHATEQEAKEHAKTMLKVYEDFAKNFLAMPAIVGEKTASERFPGAESTYTFELMMQDKKALQGGTSHYLGQNFSKAASIQYKSEEGEDIFAYTTSWGVTTRLIGAMLMVHGDDDGAVLPPRISPVHVVILPIIHKEEVKDKVLDFCNQVQNKLSQIPYGSSFVTSKIDTRDLRGGEKMWNWVKKGAPIRLEIGPRDIENNSVFLARRDKNDEKKISLSCDNLDQIPAFLDEMHDNLYQRAKSYLEDNTHKITSEKEFEEFFTNKAGFAEIYMEENLDKEQELKEKFQITPRCIPFGKAEPGECIFTKKTTTRKVIFAKAY